MWGLSDYSNPGKDFEIMEMLTCIEINKVIEKSFATLGDLKTN